MSFKLFVKMGFLIILVGIVQRGYGAVVNTRAGQDAVRTFDAGQVQSNLLNRNQPVSPQPTPGITQTQPPSAAFTEGEKIHLKLTRVVIKGNTVFKTADLEAIFSPAFNKTITLNELQQLVDKITSTYRSAGYLLSQAFLPPQHIKNGVVEVQVVEGFISKLEIKGNPGSTATFLKRYNQPVLESRPLQLALLEKALLLSNDIPGLTVQSVITPSATVPGGADLTVFAIRRRFNSYLVYDNYGTRYLGPQEVSFGVAANSILIPGDSNALHFSTTSQTRELQFGEFIHTQLLGSQGLNFLLGTNYTQTRPLFILSNFDIIGRSYAAFSSLTYPLIRSRNQNLSLSGLLNYQNVNATILGGPYYQDRIRSLTLGGTYNGNDRWLGTNTLSLNASQGFKIFGANMHFYQSRPNGRTAFTKASMEATRLQILSSRFSFYLGVEGQYALNPLLANEQFSYGGPIYGRGYDPSEIIGDRGLGGKVELRLQTTPGFRFLQSIQYYAFYDAGEIWNIDDINLPGQQSATSTGVGLNVSFIANIQGNFFIAKPLTKKVSVFVAMDQNPKQARAYFQLTARI